MQSNWKRAIRETFLNNSDETSGGQRLGDRDLRMEAADDTAPFTADQCNNVTSM